MNEATAAWLTSPEPGWSLVDLPHTVGTTTFLTGAGEDRVRVVYFRSASDPSLTGKVWFGSAAQGPPGHAHGGSIAAVLDEAMGGAAWVAGYPVVAAEITTRFKRMLPLGAAYRLRAWLVGRQGRKVEARAELLGRHDGLFAESEGLFVELDMDRLQRLAQTATDLAPYLKIRQKAH